MTQNISLQERGESPPLTRPTRTEKIHEAGPVSKGLCSPRTRGRESAGEICEGKAAVKTRSAHELVQKTGIEAVTGAYGIDCVDGYRG